MGKIFLGDMNTESQKARSIKGIRCIHRAAQERACRQNLTPGEFSWTKSKGRELDTFAAPDDIGKATAAAIEKFAIANRARAAARCGPARRLGGTLAALVGHNSSGLAMRTMIAPVKAATRRASAMRNQSATRPFSNRSARAE